MRKKTKNGFTLVELSIVLVIIGLLIGGILVAQSLIDSTKIQSQIRQFQQFDIAINSFRSKFGQLPGDSSLFSGPGDNDGVISSNQANNNAGATARFLAEVKFVWLHLQQGVSLFDNYNFDTTDDCGGSGCDIQPNDLQLVSSIISDNVGIMIANDNGWMSTGLNSYVLSSYSSSGEAEENDTDIRCVDALALDKKLDDDDADNGNFIAPGCDSGGSYSTSEGTFAQGIELKILSQTER